MYFISKRGSLPRQKIDLTTKIIWSQLVMNMISLGSANFSESLTLQTEIIKFIPIIPHSQKIMLETIATVISEILNFFYFKIINFMLTLNKLLKSATPQYQIFDSI